MLFNSYPFIILVSITFFLYYFLPVKHQVTVLIISSFVFYGYSQPYLLLLLFISGSINAIVSYRVFYEKNNENKKIIAITGILFNLLVLALFKYNHLLEDVLSSQDDLIVFLVTMPLPIGISFYTFQGMSLVMDIYKPLKKYDIKVNPDFYTHYKNTIFFISFFPQLVSGPIVKAHNFFPQIAAKYLKDIDFYYAYKNIVIGYFLKIVIADNLKDQTYWIAAPYFDTQSSLTLIVMLFGYSMQIFADFAGYSLIAIGVAALFNYKLPQNFNFPYISISITEFWRRWHMSLSSWLKEYLYIGLLGGNRIGRTRTYINILIVMFLGGLWHGAAFSFCIWGLWHGIGLIIERLFSERVHEKPKQNMVSNVIRIILVFFFVSFGWLFFKLTNIHEAIQYMVAIKENIYIPDNKLVILNIFIYSIPVIIYHLFYLLRKNRIINLMVIKDHYAYSIMLTLILTNGGIPGAFVYFQF